MSNPFREALADVPDTSGDWLELRQFLNEAANRWDSNPKWTPEINPHLASIRLSGLSLAGRAAVRKSIVLLANQWDAEHQTTK